MNLQEYLKDMNKFSSSIVEENISLLNEGKLIQYNNNCLILRGIDIAIQKINGYT